jgi:uncharacterized protein (TIGR02808 family)
MSGGETFFWNVLGYSTMAIIFIVGFVITAAIGCFLLGLIGRGGEQ